MRKYDLTFLSPLVASVLCDRSRAWTVQGFGFLRTYFGPPETPKRYRLNLWHSRFTVPNVSTTHDHPWDLKSVIVSGSLRNTRYAIIKGELTHEYGILRTGVGGGMEAGTYGSCRLRVRSVEKYGPGDTYTQTAAEIHETVFEDGTVTLNERIGDTERARVFWERGSNWVDAIPRPATAEEVTFATEYALDRLTF